VLFKATRGAENRKSVAALDWEVEVPELKTSVFLIPAGMVKNQAERLGVERESPTCCR